MSACVFVVQACCAPCAALFLRSINGKDTWTLGFFARWRGRIIGSASPVRLHIVGFNHTSIHGSRCWRRWRRHGWRRFLWIGHVFGPLRGSRLFRTLVGISIQETKAFFSIQKLETFFLVSTRWMFIRRALVGNLVRLLVFFRRPGLFLVLFRLRPQLFFRRLLANHRCRLRLWLNLWLRWLQLRRRGRYLLLLLLLWWWWCLLLRLN